MFLSNRRQNKKIIWPSLIGLTLTVALASVQLNQPTAQAAAPFGGNAFKRLILYDENLRLPFTLPNPTGSQLVLSARGLESDAPIYLAPDSSLLGSRFEGVSGRDSQRLQLTGGLNGLSTLEVSGQGTANQPDGAAATSVQVVGSSVNNSPIGVYGSVFESAAGPSYGGYFSGGSSTGLLIHRDSGDGNDQAVGLKAEAQAGGLAGRFDPDIFINGGLRADSNTRGSCGWTAAPSGTPVTCPDDRLIAGVRHQAGADGYVSEIYCCEL